MGESEQIGRDRFKFGSPRMAWGSEYAFHCDKDIPSGVWTVQGRSVVRIGRACTTYASERNRGYGYISYSEEQLGQVSVGQYWWMDRPRGIHLSLFVLEFLSLIDDVFEDADDVGGDPPTGSSTTSTTLTIVSPPIPIPAPTIPTPGMVWYPSLSAALPCHNLALNHAPTDSPGKGLIVSTRCSVTRPEMGEKVYRDEVCQDVGCGEGL